MRMRFPRATFANVIAVVALIVATTGTSVAAVTAAKNSVTTASLRKDAVTSVKIKNGAITTADLAPAARPKAGIKGATGATGAQGAPGAKGDIGPAGSNGTNGTNGTNGAPGTGPVAWAAVGSTGVLTRGSGPAVTSSTTGTGAYQVVLGRAVAGCSYQATLGNATAGLPSASSGGVFVAPSNGVGLENTILVNTFNKDGDPTNRSFHLVLFC